MASNSNTVSTKVVYDTSQATAAITKLGKDTDRAGNQASDAFDRMSEGAARFAGAGNGIAGIALDLGKAAVAAGPIGIGLGLAAVAAAAVASNLLGLPDLMKNSAEGAEAFGSALDRANRTSKLISDLQDAAKQSEFRKDRIALDKQGIEVSAQRAANREAQAQADGVLNIWKDHYRQLGSLYDQNQSKLKSSEAKLAQIQDARLEREGSTLDLLRQAAKLRDAGQFERAQGLITTAAGRDNDQWDTSAAVQAQKQLEAAFTRSVAAQRKQVAEQGQQKAGYEAGITTIEEYKRRLQGLGQVLGGDANAIANAKKNLALTKEQHDLIQKQQDAYSDVDTNVRKLGQGLTTNRGLVEEALRGLRAGLSGATNKERFIDAKGDIATAYNELNKFYTLARTGASDDALAKQADAFKDAMVEAGKEANTLPTIYQDALEALKKMDDSTGNILKGRGEITSNKGQLEELGAVTDPLAAADASAKSIYTSLAGAATATAAIARNMEGLSFNPSTNATAAINAAPGVDRGTAAAVAAVGPSPVNQNITVTLQGGMMDNATIQQFVNAVQRQARLGLG